MQYQRKTPVVNAVQWTGIHSDDRVSALPMDCDAGWLPTDMGGVVVHIGDWIVDTDGELAVMNDERFKRLYKEVN